MYPRKIDEMTLYRFNILGKQPIRFSRVQHQNQASSSQPFCMVQQHISIQQHTI